MAKPLPDHLRVPWKIRQALAVFGLGWIGMPIIVFFGLAALASTVPLAHSALQGLDNNTIDANFGLVIVDALAAFALMAHYLKRYGAHWRQVGWRPFNVWRTLLLLAAVFAAFIILVGVTFSVVAWLVPSFNANQAQTNSFTGSAAATHPSIAFWALVILPPIIEETVFRGFIFPAIASRWGLVAGTILTSLLFGIAHLQANVSLYTFILSLLLCYMYYKLRSIFPGMALHMINNYLAYQAILHH